jgi:hypothetical protein
MIAEAMSAVGWKWALWLTSVQGVTQGKGIDRLAKLTIF